MRPSGPVVFIWVTRHVPVSEVGFSFPLTGDISRAVTKKAAEGFVMLEPSCWAVFADSIFEVWSGCKQGIRQQGIREPKT
jgi:hypothetical protein